MAPYRSAMLFLSWIVVCLAQDVSQPQTKLRGNLKSNKTDALDLLRKAWNMKDSGFLVSSLSPPPFQVSQSASLLNKDTIRHLYSNWGIIYYPQSSPRAPKIECCYPCDANTDLRKAATGNPCSLYKNISTSGPCKVGTPHEYANQYLDWWNGRTEDGSPPEATCWVPDFHTMLQFQKELMIQYEDRAPEIAYYNRFLGYNEVILEHVDFESVIGFFFAHPGGFREGLRESEKAWLKADGENNGPVPQQWLDALKTGSLPFFELSGFDGPFWSKKFNSSPDTEENRGASQAMLKNIVSILVGKQSPPAADEVIRLAPKSMIDEVVGIACSAA